MSMPEFPNLENLTKEQALSSIIASIAMEEAALSHIINAEGEKIQFALANKCRDVEQVIAVNDSVGELLERVFDLQLVLKSKLRLAKSLMDYDADKKPDNPFKPNKPDKPDKPCKHEKPNKPCAYVEPDKPSKPERSYYTC